jgi:DNA-binding HxlR family transcriptional regulator
MPETPVAVATSDEERGEFLREVLDRIGDKWSMVAICRLDGRPRRFNELRRMTGGITQRMLSATLRRLERDGLVERTVFPTVPPQVEYALTDTGQTLHAVLYQLVDWSNDNLERIQRARAAYDSASQLAREHATGADPAVY